MRLCINADILTLGYLFKTRRLPASQPSSTDLCVLYWNVDFYYFIDSYYNYFPQLQVSQLPKLNVKRDIIAFHLFRKLREKDVSKYHIQLSLSMLCMLVVSLALIALSVEDLTDPYGGCVTVSVLVHYFTLVSVMWMGAEALVMFIKLAFVFTRITTKFLVTVSIVCWSKITYT